MQNKTIAEIDEAVRAACIAAQPSILDLKFGCEIELKDEDFTRVMLVGRVGKCTKHKKAESCDMDCDIEDALAVEVPDEGDGTYEPKGWIIKEADTKFYTVLGRPLQINDVLLVIDKTESRNEYVFTTTGHFMSGLGKEVDIDIFWDLTKPYAEQEEKVRRAVASLLGIG